MTVRAGFIYALLIALGFLLWTHAFDVHHQLGVHQATEVVNQTSASIEAVPWTSAEAVYECAMKAEELGVVLESVEVSAESMQGNMNLRGEMEDLKAYYQWLETEGYFRSILSLNLETDEDDKSVLTVQYDL